MLSVLIAVATLLAAMTWSQMTARPVARSIAVPGPLVVVGMPKLTLSDTPATRAGTIWSMAREGATGSLLTRDLSAHSCSNQSWLTFSAGTRTTLGRSVPETPSGEKPQPCPAELKPVVTGTSAYFPYWKNWRKTTLGRAQPADIGKLASTLEAHGQCVSAAGPYAALGAANHQGRISHYRTDPMQADLTSCPVTFIGLPDPVEANDDLDWLRPQIATNATVVVVGMADDSGPERLHAVVITGPAIAHGLLTSDSTRQTGVLQTTDLSALVLSRVGAAAPHLPEGRMPLVQPSGSPTAPAIRVTEHIRVLAIEHAFVFEFFAWWLGISVPLMLLGSLWIWKRRDGHTRTDWIVIRATGLVAATTAAMPVSTFLVNAFPWWRTRHIHAVLAGGILLIALAIALVAMVGPWRKWRAGPIAFLCLVTMFVIGQDVTHGSKLQFVSMMGLQPVYGGRAFGMGNVGFALFATSALLLAAIVAGPYSLRGLRWRRNRGLAALTVVAIGVVTVAVDGYPTWGGDGGGSVALIPAFGYLTLVAAGARITFLRGLVIGAIAFVFGVVIAVIDYLRPPSQRTHLGDMVASLRDSGDLTPITRIWQANWTMLTSSPLTLCVPVLLIASIVLLSRQNGPLARPVMGVVRDTAMLYEGLVALLICWTLAFLSNDSGTAIPPTGMLIAGPLLVLLAATHGRPTRQVRAQ